MGAGSDTRFWRINVRDSHILLFFVGIRVVMFRTPPGRPALARMILRLTLSSIWPRTLPRRPCRSERTESSANSWETSCLVNDRPSLFVRTLMSVENEGTTLHSAKYHLLPVDLRTPPLESIAQLLTSTSPSSPFKEGPTTFIP